MPNYVAWTCVHFNIKICSHFSRSTFVFCPSVCVCVLFGVQQYRTISWFNELHFRFQSWWPHFIFVRSPRIFDKSVKLIADPIPRTKLFLFNYRTFDWNSVVLFYAKNYMREKQTYKWTFFGYDKVFFLQTSYNSMVIRLETQCMVWPLPIDRLCICYSDA